MKRNPCNSSYPILVEHGSFRLKIYRSTNRGRDLFCVKYYEGRKRRQRNFADEDKAKAEAKKIARELGSGHGAALSLTGKDRDNYEYAIRQLEGLDIPLGAAVEQFAAAIKKLKGVSLLHAVDFFIEKTKTALPDKLLPEVVDEFLASKEQDGLSVRYLETCKNHAIRFAGAFASFIGNIKACEIDDWLRGLKVAPRTRNNIRDTVVTLFSFARTRGYLPKGDTEAEAVPKAKVRGNRIGIFSSEELDKILCSAGDGILPAIAIGAFAGVRQAEIRRLNWPDIKFEEGHIEVAVDQGKNPSRRIVPLLPVLDAWLSPEIS